MPGRLVTWGWLALLAAGLAAPFVVYPVFAMNVLCLALFASAFNLLLGYTGLLSFGHAAFLGASAYATGWALRSWGLPPEVAVLLGTALAAALGLAFGALAIRRSGIYFAMITLGFAQLVYFLVVQLPWTGGEDGLQGIPRGRALGLLPLDDPRTAYWFVYAAFLAGFWLLHRAIHSPFGHVLRAIRENEPRAVSLGYDVARYKLLAFVLSAGVSGLAGGLKAVVLQFASLSDVHWHRSGEVVLMTLLGGMGTVLGPSVGALLVVALENYLADTGSWVTVITGAVFVACVVAFRRGIVGEVRALVRRSFTGGKP
ncbi:branched-chain amino acid ABC transporter permease [Anaeromyxobacter dehalogenans]|uniref:Amino acid/amide ABC transporter membrane protein 2, HAAT family n=1 Tax=Anaeromyxobacter dehalogenans (strain 2CP-C) TaxID=290397 RepID=Q2IJT0_ANADE|nr:branched-chain amino acid ABC transporter permease [Anaeromyxobacter dehalogenans]ABC81909.1 amino acid/amide ABC transporter membrane protein 2, HAAT family [Anaeromyxobacter dehalogenans 2CP-C]